MVFRKAAFITLVCLGSYQATHSSKSPSIAQLNFEGLISAVKAGNADAVKSKLSDEAIKAMINNKDKKDLSVLDYALVFYGSDGGKSQAYRTIITDLLEAGADLPNKNAMYWQYSPISRLLKQEELRRQKKAPDGRSQTQPKSRPSRSSVEKMTPEKSLFNAATNGNAEDVEKILGAGNVNVNMKNDDYPFIAPLSAAWLGYRNDIGRKKADQYIKIFKLLIDAGANKQDFKKQTAQGALALGTIEALISK